MKSRVPIHCRALRLRRDSESRGFYRNVRTNKTASTRAFVEVKTQANTARSLLRDELSNTPSWWLEMGGGLSEFPTEQGAFYYAYRLELIGREYTKVDSWK